ncbi:hypothetical protein CLU79DRAFT_701090 [Phycomyces nitens]|nr:hypothetical protein CLU79DRAFT_701090 [Phycomyces nitens]
MKSSVKKLIASTIEQHNEELRAISIKIHDNPELGNREFDAFRLLTDYLETKGFKVTRGVAGLETGFIAEYSNSDKGRRVGFCSEYDALPGVGHGCGHNLIAITGLACALAIKALFDHKITKGTVVLFGTPAEESTSGKITYVLNNEVQSRVDVALMLHPMATDNLYARFLALDSLKVEFFGRASHAGMAPWNGINAVDALMQGWDNMSMMRQQTLSSNRIHGIITDGGKSANVIPDYASAAFYARSLTREQLAELKVKLENCFKAAGIATGCEVKLTWAASGPIEDVFQNDTLTSAYQEYMEEEGITFASRAEEEQIVSGSTDMGNITHVIPATHPCFGIHTTATNHTYEFTQAAGTEQAHKDALLASRCLARAAADVLLDNAVLKAAVSDFKKGKN